MERVGVILIHGAGLGAWAWKRVLPLLGVPGVAVDLPLRGDKSKALMTLGLDAYVETVVKAAEGLQAERLVLVGHSVGGEIALCAAERLKARLAGVVLVSAIVPPRGRSMLSLQPWARRLFMRLIFRFGPPLPPEKVIRASGCADLDEATCRELVSRYSPESPRLFLDKAVWSLPDGLPCWYVKTLQDRTLPVPLQELMIARARPTRVAELGTGHLPMLAKPEAFATILKEFIHALPNL
jgi:pimeloyl-ACP methyl ester carboxylesterase